MDLDQQGREVSVRRGGWVFLLMFVIAGRAAAGELTALEQLGKRLFFDANLSSPAGQSCASCHSPETGFTGPVSATNQKTAVYQGAAPSRFGNRKPPSAAYASFSPKLGYEAADETYVGGQFWDGRALNLVEQAKGPFLNPLEMNNADAAEVVRKVQAADYWPLFVQNFEAELKTADMDAAFEMIARAIAAYEASSEVNSFSSKYDAYLAGKAELTVQEKRGLDLYVGKANCAACHPNDRGADGSPPLFTDFTYDNVGAPANPRNPFYQQTASVNPEGAKYRDLGIGGVLKQPDHYGKFKVPTLRNIDKRPSPDFVKSYLHNGTFKNLKEVVHFYNSRDQLPSEFADPDVLDNVNREELGKLGLTPAEEDDVVVFLTTLSDGYWNPASAAPPGPVAGPSPSGNPLVGDRFYGAGEVARVRRFHPRPPPVASEDRPPVR
ncbi:cytochrome-c peroxidase [Planctomicrobium piriforme]|uniref:cytochrome-c peroxidase n=1 Tax=Planctomicrobium piriforme TaxID=1576369 RepID=UPI001C319800|nr:cytochrome c peroxidase [Planctomicrobium piriforme]